MKTLLKLFLLPCVLVFSSVLPASESFTLESLMQELAKKENSSATFEEYRYSSFLTKPVRLSGRLFYKKPDLLIKENNYPTDEKLKIISDRVEFEKIEDGKKIKRILAIEDYPFLESMVVGLRATFAGDLKKLRKFYNIKLSGNSINWKLELTTRAVVTDPDKLFENSVKKMIISGSASDFSKVEMYDADGEKTVIKITPL